MKRILFSLTTCLSIMTFSLSASAAPDAAQPAPAAAGAVTLVADGKFHTVELGPFTAGKELGLYLAISRDGSMPEVYFDCMWLRQEK